MNIEKDKEKLDQMIRITSNKTGFSTLMIEKDYYLTLLLSGINQELDENLIFKGGTCLSKIYLDYYRLSEDLDFTMQIPDKNIRTIRSRIMKNMKIINYLSKFDLKLDKKFNNGGRNESRQYIYRFIYDSIINNQQGYIKLDISLRFNPMLPIENLEIKHKFYDPFNNNLLFSAGKIKCLSFEELVAEKLRAAVSRKIIAPRDFFDLWFLLKNKFDFTQKKFLDIYARKLKEENIDKKIELTLQNLNRTEGEILGMKSRIEEELFGVLKFEDAKDFNVDSVLNYFNNISKKTG